MSITHISTIDSHRAGIPQVAHKCFICENKTMFDDWVGARCDTCGADTAWEENFAGLVRSVRNRTLLSRKQFSFLIGYTPATIKKYEWTHPTEKYYEKFKKCIRDYYQKIGDEGLKKLKEAMMKDSKKTIDKLLAEFNEE